MNRRVWIGLCAVLMCVAAVGGSPRELACTVTFADEMGWSWGLSNAEFRAGGRAIVRATPELFDGDNTRLIETSAANLTLDIATKELDKSSVILGAWRSKRIFPSVELALMGTVGDKEIRITYRMSDVSVTRVVTTGGTRVMSLNFAEVKIDY